MPADNKAPDFMVIIESVDSIRLEEIAGELARAFALTQTFAEQILKGVPLVFLEKIGKSEVKVITPRLVELSRRGLEFRITARVPERLPRVQWPVRPLTPIGWVGTGEGATVRWENTAFVCPSCGEAFMIKRIGGPRMKDPSSRPSPIPSLRSLADPVAPPASAPPAPSTNAPPVPVLISAEQIEAIVDSDALSAEGVGPEGIPAELHNVEVIESLPDMPPSPHGSLNAADATEIGDMENVDLVPLEELPDVAAESVDGSEDPAAGETGKRYNVFLSRIATADRKEKAARLLAEIKGIDPREARALADKSIIPVAKDVGQEEAEQILERFKMIKVFGRINAAAQK